MVQLNPPSYNPANKGTLEGLLIEAFRALLLDTDDMLPCKVVSFDRVSNLVTVQPQIMTISTSGKLVSKAPLASVHVFTLGAGNFFLSFPLAAGNTGWIKASDRDISLYMQSMTESRPNTDRLHSFEHGVFLPDVKALLGLANNAAMVLGSLDGTTKIEMVPNTITMTAVNIDLVSQTLTHNGIDISGQHEHQDSGGSGIGGPPVGAT